MSREEIRIALRALDIRARLVFRMGIIDGMRPGEIVAIRLGKLGPKALLVDQRLYGSNFDTPKGRKGKNTVRVVALASGTLRDIEIWRPFLPDQT